MLQGRETQDVVSWRFAGRDWAISLELPLISHDSHVIEKTDKRSYLIKSDQVESRSLNFVRWAGTVQLSPLTSSFGLPTGYSCDHQKETGRIDHVIIQVASRCYLSTHEIHLSPLI